MNELLESVMRTFGFHSPEEEERFRKEVGRYELVTDFITAIRNGEEMQELREDEVERIRVFIEKEMDTFNDDTEDIDYEDVTLIQLS